MRALQRAMSSAPGEGLDEVIVGAQVQAFDAVIDGVAGGEAEDGGVDLVALRRSWQEGETIDAGQHDVEDDEIVGVGLGEVQGFGTIEGAVDGVAFVAQAVGD